MIQIKRKIVKPLANKLITLTSQLIHHKMAATTIDSISEHGKGLFGVEFKLHGSDDLMYHTNNAVQLVSDSIECLDFIQSNGFPIDQYCKNSACLLAVEYQHLDCLEYVHKHGCVMPVDREFVDLYTAAKNRTSDEK